MVYIGKKIDSFYDKGNIPFKNSFSIYLSIIVPNLKFTSVSDEIDIFI